VRTKRRLVGLAIAGPLILAASLRATPIAAADSAAPCSEDLASAPADDARLRLFDDPPASVGDPPPPAKRFGLAAGEVFFINLMPWLYGRFLLDDPIAHVGPKSWGANFRDLPNLYRTFDRDGYIVNQVSHPGISGSFYFNAARSNGYSFWESVPWTLVGSFFWETFGETEKVDINDVASTFLGGVNWGEITYRSSRMLLDDETTGAGRVLRELGGLVIDPAGAMTRLLTGDMFRVGPNPPDRLPSRLAAVVDVGYRRRGDEDPAHPDQALLSGELRYGDPFVGTLTKPFDVFLVSGEIAQPSNTLVTRFEAYGFLADGEIASPPRSEHRLGLILGYEYQNSLNRVYQDENIGLRFVSRFPLADRTSLRTDVGVAAVPLAAVESDYPAQNEAQPYPYMSIGTTIGRPYDYAPGGTAEVAARIRRDETDLVEAGYAVRLVRSVNGISHDSRVQSAFAEGRVPLGGDLSAGAGWSWDERLTSYDTLRSVRRSAAEWKVFASWTLR
jgi:hypothetical protein